MKKVARQNRTIINNYERLLVNREEIEKTIQQTQQINTAYEDTSLVVNSNYLWFVVFLLIVILLIFLLFHFSLSQGGGEQSGGSNKQNVYILLFMTFSFFCFISLYNLLNKNK